VVVSRELCLGCRVGIPPQQYLYVLSGERVVTCGSCRRILIAQAHLAAGPSPA
jgi:predicted  nucleic acid-binding Zn-ribbon protein